MQNPYLLSLLYLPGWQWNIGLGLRCLDILIEDLFGNYLRSILFFLLK